MNLPALSFSGYLSFCVPCVHVIVSLQVSVGLHQGAKAWAPQRLWVERLASEKGHAMPHLLLTKHKLSFLGSSGRWYQSIKIILKHVKRISNGDGAFFTVEFWPWKNTPVFEIMKGWSCVKHHSSPWLDQWKTEQSMLSVSPIKKREPKIWEHQRK